RTADVNNLNVIDNFMQTFIRYIDSGFGLLQGDVAALTTVLIGIDITLAALFWVMDGEANILARLIKKVLYVGSFAFIINNFSTLSMAFFNNFVTIVVLLFAWVVVILSFFILAIQLFITILEFKLTTLAGFVLVPFALW